MAKWFLLMAAVYLVLTLCWAEMDCWNYLVSGPQGVPDAAISASSYYPLYMLHHNPACGRLYMYPERSSTGCQAPNAAGWCSLRGDPDPYIQVDFSDLKNIVGVVMQQRQQFRTNNDIITYQVSYSVNGEDWEYLKSEADNQTFYVPADSAEENTERQSNISPPVVARYVRIRPLTWVDTPTGVPCLRFDVIGCTHGVGTSVQVARRRRFAYLPLPAGSISDYEVIMQGHTKDLGECSLRCHRDVTCRSFSYSNAYKDCKAYSVNKYSQLSARAGEQSISEKQYLYYFDMSECILTFYGCKFQNKDNIHQDTL
ncbi:Hemocytin [Mizuhopecten yessoensis]|uniref:Hemocytin n=1 Tax=Mizuhopecten yessoensis TaxID=6573 RepID=A0A210QAM1_MIZYE|nr:Hemocytin [Mizuhopecten yessoensis]